jgi:hypothetical protein
LGDKSAALAQYRVARAAGAGEGEGGTGLLDLKISDLAADIATPDAPPGAKPGAQNPSKP